MVIYQNVVSTFNVCSPRTLSNCEPLLLCMAGTRRYVLWGRGGNRKAMNLLYRFPLHLIPFENLLWQKLKKIMRPYYSQTLSKWGSLSVIQSRFCGYFCWVVLSIVPFFPTLVQFVPYCLMQFLPCCGSFQTAAVRPPTSIPTMSSNSSKQVVCFDPSYTRARKCSPMQISAGGRLYGSSRPTQGGLTPAWFDFERIITLFIKFPSYHCLGKQSQ